MFENINPFNTENILKYKKLQETLVLNMKFLFSTVHERKLVAQDFDIITSVDSQMFGYHQLFGKNIYKILAKRVYVPLDRHEQKLLLGITLRWAENNLKNYDTRYAECSEIFSQLDAVKSLEDFDKIVPVLFLKIINMIPEDLHELFENIPAELVKKNIMNILCTPLTMEEFLELSE